MSYDESVADRVRRVLKRRKNVTERKMFDMSEPFKSPESCTMDHGMVVGCGHVLDGPRGARFVELADINTPSISLTEEEMAKLLQDFRNTPGIAPSEAEMAKLLQDFRGHEGRERKGIWQWVLPVLRTAETIVGLVMVAVISGVAAALWCLPFIVEFVPQADDWFDALFRQFFTSVFDLWGGAGIFVLIAASVALLFLPKMVGRFRGKKSQVGCGLRPGD